MFVVVIVIAVVAIAVVVGWSITARRLTAERQRNSAAETAAAAATASLSAQAESERQARVEADQLRETATAEAADAVQARDVATLEAAAAIERARLADERSTEVFAGFDPQLIWDLEQARSERLWRLSLALGPDLDSVFQGEPDPLRVALQVEVDASREEVGAIVELDAELPSNLTPAGAVLVLRSTQELLATVVRRCESTTVRIVPDERDMLVTIHSIDEVGDSVAPGPLAIPPSKSFEMIDDGVRIHNVVAGI